MDQNQQAAAEAPKAAAPETAATTTTATATAPTAKTADAAVEARFKARYDRLVERLTGELKQAGKVGKQQWEDALKSARDFITRARPELKREDIDARVAGFKKDVEKALKTVRSRSEGLTRSRRFLNARDKGAEFLLKITTRLKGTLQTIETNLEGTLKDRAKAAAATELKAEKAAS